MCTGYLDDLRREGYVIVTPEDPPLFTADGGGFVLEFGGSRLAIRLSAATVDALPARVANARRREAEMEIDDSGLWPTP
jgi:hypothetical protein